MTDRHYIVTGKQLQKLKDILNSDAFFAEYWSEEVRKLRHLVEIIEAQEMFVAVAGKACLDALDGKNDRQTV